MQLGHLSFLNAIQCKAISNCIWLASRVGKVLSALYVMSALNIMFRSLFSAQAGQVINQLLDWCHVRVLDSSVLKITEREENTWNSMNLFLHIICVICDNDLVT